MSDNFNELRSKSGDPSKVYGDGIIYRSKERQAMDSAESAIHQSGIAADAMVEAAKIKADYAEKAAGIRSGAAQQGALTGGLGKVLGAALPMIISSDRECKENISPIDNALETLRALKPVSYNYKEEYSTNFDRKHHGFIAQDYKEVLPDATYFDPEANLLCIDTGDLIGLLVRSIQQLESRIMYLEAQRALTEVK